MKQNTLRILVASTLLASTSVALALPFNSFDPRSMAMGGAGVAVGDAKMAPFFNPALLTVTREEDDFSIALPIIGVRAYDPDKFVTSVDDFQNGNFVSNLDNSMITYNNDKGSGNAALISANLISVTTDLSTLSTEFTKLSDKPLQVEVGAGMVVGIPSKSFGGAVYATGWGAMGGVIKYKDNQTLQDFVTASNTINTTITGSGPGQCNNVLTVACLAPLAGDPLVTTYFTVDTTNPIAPTVNFNTNQDLKSSVDIRGVVLSEVGFAMSHEFNLFGSDVGIGITPKVVRATLLDYSANVNSSSTGNASDSDYTAKYTSANLDLGLAKDYGNGWRTGFVIKNIIPQTYDFKSIAPGAGTGTAQQTTGTLNMKAQARVGASHSTSWSTVALDVDLTANDPAGFENKSQYVALGGELNAFSILQLRLGYRADLKNSNRSVASVGVGLGPLDVAVSGSANEVGASASLGFTF